MHSNFKSVEVDTADKSRLPLSSIRPVEFSPVAFNCSNTLPPDAPKLPLKLLADKLTLILDELSVSYVLQVITEFTQYGLALLKK